MAKPSGDIHPWFWRRGANVEVRSEEPGFIGAWFSATIVEPPVAAATSSGKRKSFNSNKVLVQYDTFVNEKDPTKPLTEYTSVLFLRPSPPPEAPDKVFEAGDYVDAFHNDAWWKGVVVSVDEGNYTVGFEDPPELLRVGRNEIRSRMNWKNGVWSKPKKEWLKESIYSPGSQIEVRLVKEHLWSAWIPAVYGGSLHKNLCLVQYKSQKNNDNGGMTTEGVSNNQIRPRPPRHEDTDFRLLDMVDAFDGMNWHVGNITKVLSDKKYLVAFKLTKEEKEFRHSELRRHLEWIDNKWESDFSRFGSGMDDKEQIQHAHTSSRKSEVATPLKSLHVNKDSTGEENPYASSQKIQKTQLDPCIDKSAYRKTSNELKVQDQPNDDATFLSPTPSKKLKRHPGESVYVYMRNPQTKESKKKGLVSNVVKIGSPLREPGSQAASTLGESHRKRKSQFDGSSPPLKIHVAVKNGNRRDKVDEECIGDEHAMDTTESSGIQLVSKLTGRSLAGNSGLLPIKEINHHDEDGMSSRTKVKGSKDITTGGNVEAAALKIQEDGAQISPKRPTDRDQPLAIILIDEVNSENTMQGSARNPSGMISKLNMVAMAEISPKNHAHDQPLPLCIYKMDSENSMEGSGSEDPTRDEIAEATAMEIEVAGAEISAKTHLHDQCDMGSDENTLEGNPSGTAKTPFHYQFQASSIDEMHSGHTMKDSCNSSTGTRKQQSEVVVGQGEIGITGAIEREDTPHLPFVKKSPFWKMLESTDAFKRFRQQPHFMPLLKVKMLCREGLALGSMHMFADVVESISQLQVDDPKDSITDVLEALVELERLGFDVKALSDLLNEMQDMKLKFAELKNKSDGVKIMITNHKLEITKGTDVVSRMDAEINDLEEKMRELQAKRAKAVSEKAANDSEINKLESEANSISAGIQSIKHDFQNLAAAALW